jgi:hypothetical protein
VQPSTDEVGRAEDQEGSLAIHYVGCVNHDTQQETRRINEDVAFAAADLLRPVLAMGPPFSVVFTDCESMIAAEGWAQRPIWRRSCSRK